MNRKMTTTHVGIGMIVACVLIGNSMGARVCAAQNVAEKGIVLVFDTTGNLNAAKLTIQVDAIKVYLANEDLFPQDGSLAIGIVLYGRTGAANLGLIDLDAASLSNTLFPALDAIVPQFPVTGPPRDRFDALDVARGILSARTWSPGQQRIIHLGQAWTHPQPRFIAEVTDAATTEQPIQTFGFTESTSALQENVLCRKTVTSVSVEGESEALQECGTGPGPGPGPSCSCPDDGLFCTLDFCSGGVCIHPSRSCSDSNVCTDDSCDEGNNVCTHTPNNNDCDDSDACTDASVCNAGICEATSTIDCDDGDVCNGSESCVAGVCQAGTPLSCDDGNPCTDDTCDPTLGCQNVNDDLNSCDDGDVCDGSESCVAGVCQAGTSLSCDDGNPCTDDTCDPTLGCQNVNDDLNSCVDGDLCNGTESCVAGMCQPGSPLVCDDGNPCTDDACDTALGCQNVNDDLNSCVDGDVCNGSESCVAGVCQAGTALSCDDGDVCTDDVCDPALGCTWVNNVAPCNDHDICTINTTCIDGVCGGGAPADCSDGNVCTEDNCDSSFGCVNTLLTCDDLKESTYDACHSVIGCMFRRNSCGECGATITPAQIDGGSFDPDGDPITLLFTEVDGQPVDALASVRLCGLGVHTLVLTAEDGLGAQSECTSTVTVLDVTDPSITCPADIAVACDASTDPAATGSATAFDGCDGVIAVAHSDSASGACPVSITRTWSAADAAGNPAQCTQQITVADDQAPALTCPPDVSVNSGGSTDPAATGTATATDNCDAGPTMSFSDQVMPSGCPANGAAETILRTWAAIDSCGNANQCVQSIAVMSLVAALDVRPGACPNPFNRAGNGVLPISLLGTPEFDVAQVDLASVRISRADCAGGEVAPNEGPPGPSSMIGNGGTPFFGVPCECLSGPGQDAFLDLQMKFPSADLTSVLGLDTLVNGSDVEFVLTGRLVTGEHFTASDCVRLVPPAGPPGLVSVDSNLCDTWINSDTPDNQMDGGGFEVFDRSYAAGLTVTYTAEVLPGGPGFVGWKVDGNMQTAGEQVVAVTVLDSGSVLEALYELQCCDPQTSAWTPIDDGNECTTDVCNPDGTVTHSSVANPGSAFFDCLRDDVFLACFPNDPLIPETTVIENGCSVIEQLGECYSDHRNGGDIASCTNKLWQDLRALGFLVGISPGTIQSCVTRQLDIVIASLTSGDCAGGPG